MNPRVLLILCAVLLVATTASATTFVVPTDEQMVAKSDAIVIGTIEGSYVQETDRTIRTIYELRVERAIKGDALRDQLLRFSSPGGIVGDHGVSVAAAAHFTQGDRVLLFLSDDNGEWTPTDLTLGKFRFVTSTAGDRLLVRDMEDVVGWDQSGTVHHEKVRREAGFLRFVEEKARGRRVDTNYEVDASTVTIAPETTSQISANAAAYPAATYTSWVSSQPTRWPNISAGVQFWKRSDQNIPGASDGGVSVIQNGLAAWNNECGSVINLIYAGQRATASANHDGINVVEFNDPQGRVSGSWTGAGTVAITFLSFSNTHTFDGQTWWNISDADVVFQDGYPATHAGFATAMTHELGHAIGWRHSNQHYDGGGACDSSVEECTTAAIMNATVVANYGYTLQPWDINAAQSVYPGGTCGTPPPSCTPPTITSQPQSSTIAAGTSVTLSVSASGTAPLSYQWYVGTSGSTASPIPGATGPTLAVTPSATTSYWVRVSNSCGSVNSATSTITISQSSTGNPAVLPSTSANWRMAGAGDFTGDGYRDIVLQNNVSGAIYVWSMQGTKVVNTEISIGRTSSPSWQVRAVADFDANGSPDLVLQNANTGTVYIWTMSRTTILNTENFVLTTSSPNWKIVAAADFNADSNPDLLLQNSATREVVVWTMSRLRVVNTDNFLLTSSPGWTAMAAADIDRTGYADVILRNSGSGQNVVWYTSALRVLSTGNFLPPMSGSGWRIVAAADFDNDGYADLLWQNSSTNQTQIWLMRGLALK